MTEVHLIRRNFRLKGWQISIEKDYLVKYSFVIF